MAKSTPVSVRLAPETFKAAKEMSRKTSRSLGSIVSELTEEALRMRMHPGVVFVGSPGDRRAKVEGAGLEVWQVITVYRDCAESVERTLNDLGCGGQAPARHRL
jgi:hypothetical protein